MHPRPHKLQLLAIVLFSLLSLWPASAQDEALARAGDGLIELGWGRLYVPNDLEWQASKLEKGSLLVGHKGTLSLAILYLNEEHKADNTEAVSLTEKHLLNALKTGVSKVKLLETQTAPYPWPESLELRFASPQNCSVYLGSSSQKTLLVGASGPESAMVANSVAASFKEDLEFRRQTEAKGGRAARILSMLGTASTFLLLAAALFPMALKFFTNRRRSQAENPFRPALTGLTVGFFIAVIFDYFFIARFSWSTWYYIAQAMGASLARYIFLGFIISYFAKKWESEAGQTSSDE